MSTALYKKYGLPGQAFLKKNMVMLDLPADIAAALPVVPKRLYINNALITPLENALRCLIIRGKHTELKTWDGLYNNRPIRGYEKKYAAAVASGNNELAGKYLSYHAWGTAIDVNAAWNGLGKTPSLSAGFVKCFTDNGFIWGGNFARKDGMHFQLADEYI